ncbi:hypothetical protein [Chryseolinea lacunae]|uniref:GerMN domain-containing protein n=1 Tax=Chryseolinea lacunae TaxID=2801331 RepID=A0ABS1KW99_9BACT|nr:hypothetical protein [Chryseolinea lacunae]MBL0743694.1 hypothetical protein [Chryseolinea lacunae]
MTRPIFVLLFCLSLFHCTSPKSPAVAFYYWRTTFDLSPEEQWTLKENNVSHLYVRYFDVVLKNGVPMPLSAVAFRSAPGALNIVPVVYLKNEVMLAKDVDVNDLAKKILSLILQVNKQQNITTSEVQIDCDWTLTSKDTYFSFLEALKKAGAKKLSATIRLHQVKYFKRTGVPAVDRGVLMYYNMGHIAADSSNSIYDRRTATRYTESLKHYPLPLDVALPVFSWGLHIRGNKVIALLNKVDVNTFAGDTSFRKQEGIPFFEVTHNVLKLDHFFEAGDRIKIESIAAADLTEMANDLTGVLAQPPAEVIFYDLDTFNLKHYRDEDNLYQNTGRAF